MSLLGKFSQGLHNVFLAVSPSNNWWMKKEKVLVKEDVSLSTSYKTVCPHLTKLSVYVEQENVLS